MLYIYCGEDTTTSRALYIKEVEKYRLKGAEVVSIHASAIVEVERGIANNLSLFGTQIVFCLENLEKFGFKKSTKTKTDQTYDAIASLTENKNVIILDFEDGKQGRQLKLKDLALVKESKPSTTIFKLLDECIPGNKDLFIHSLRTVCQTQDEMFVFIMIYRHIRQLILTGNGDTAKLPPWQKYKIIGQAKKWDTKKLMDFYSGLIKIEINSKTSSNPFGVRKSIEILAVHYL